MSDIWIDRAYPDYMVRVRKQVGDEIETMATFVSYAQAEQYIRDLESPSTSDERPEA